MFTNVIRPATPGAAHSMVHRLVMVRPGLGRPPLLPPPPLVPLTPFPSTSLPRARRYPRLYVRPIQPHLDAAARWPAAERRFGLEQPAVLRDHPICRYRRR